MISKTWARIDGEHVAELVVLDAVLLPGQDIFAPDLAACLVDVTTAVPRPQPGWSYDGAAFAPPVAQPITPEALVALKAGLCDDVDRQAQAFRDRYVTPGGAQAATYLFKQAQAQAALAAQTTTDAGKTAAQLAALYPYLANEIGITLDPTTGQPATDLYGVARAVMATVQAWQPLNLAVEAMRLKTKGAITAATTEAAAQAAHEAVAWPAA